MKAIAVPQSRSPRRATSPCGLTTVELVIPVYNEASALPRCLAELDQATARLTGFSVQVTVVDNGSTDATWTTVQTLARAYPWMSAIRLVQRGRGHALRAAWAKSQADVVAYMDVDLSTDLRDLAPLLRAVAEGPAQLATGSRLLPGSKVKRSIRRELLSRAYNTLLRRLLAVQFRDAQCGFKAGRREFVQRLLPAIQDGGWFFDTELLVRAQWAHLTIAEVPVEWIEDGDSRVRIVPTIVADLKGIFRLRRVAAAGRRQDTPGTIPSTREA